MKKSIALILLFVCFMAMSACTTSTTVVTDAPTTTDTGAVSSNAPVTSDNAGDTAGITEDEAKQIAFDDAQVAAEDVLYQWIKLDFEDGRQVYEVEFYAGNTEYDYEIDANNGTIISYDHELENLQPGQTGTSAEGTTQLDLEAAKEIALQEAGLTAEQVTFKKTAFEKDDGREIYQIEFVYDQMEYDYEIDANSGAILEMDKDSVFD
jgi:uncharacterized membrane protein YkoI